MVLFGVMRILFKLAALHYYNLFTYHPFKYLVHFPKSYLSKGGCSYLLAFTHTHTHTPLPTSLIVPRNKTGSKDIHIFEALGACWKLIPWKIWKICSTFRTIHLNEYNVPGTVMLTQLSEGLWASGLISLTFDFLICKMRVMSSPSCGCCRNEDEDVNKVPVGAQWTLVFPPCYTTFDLQELQENGTIPHNAIACLPLFSPILWLSVWRLSEDTS